MSTTQQPAVVVLGAQGVQVLEERDPVSAAIAWGHAEALIDRLAADVVGIEFDHRLPATTKLAAAARLGREAAEFEPAPAEPRPVLYHVLAAPREKGLWDLVPRWAAGPETALVVSVYESPDPGGRSIPLLRAADALLVGDDRVADVVTGLGIAVERMRVLGPGELVGESVDAAYDVALRRRARRLARGRGHAGPRNGHRGARLAIVTPLPPMPSGISFYSLRLIEALARRLSIDVYREDDQPLNPFASRAVRCFPARGFEWRWELTAPSFPPLYCLGNNRYHLQAWRALMHRPGDVLLHDVKLAGLYGMLTDAGALTGSELAERVRTLEGRRFESIEDPGLSMIAEVIDHARRIYVHTEAGRARVIEQRPERAGDVFVVPFAVPPARPSAARAQGDPVVAAFGYVQQGRLLVDVAGELRSRRPDVRLRVIGQEVRPGELDELRAVVAAQRLEPQVELLGWLDDEHYELELERATVALQLRSHAHGETSAAVADCLAAGIPTIVNDFGAMSELPGDAVLRVSAYPTAMEISSALLGLLSDAEQQQRLSAGALDYARAHSADHAANALITRITRP